jgi:hypothetical protein
MNITENDMKFDIDKFVKYLNRYKSVPELYDWNVTSDKLVRLETLSEKQVQIKEINELSSSYEKELQLKKIVGQKLKETFKSNTPLFEKLSLWIIKDWGGITTAKDDETIKLINVFLEQDKPDFNRIASTSKVGAFLYPDRNVIYNSRVAYSLNWIILSENAGQKFFPIPDGRNSKMVAFDMNVLIRLKNVSFYRPDDINDLKKRFIKNADKKVFIDRKDAYSELNNLVKQINQQLWKGDREKEQNLFFTEMLLFSIADREVFMDITNNLNFNK